MGVLTGVVTAPNAAPLAQARVTISDTPLGTATDSSGSFRVAQIPAGIRTLEVKMLGYAPLALPVEILPGETLHLLLALSAETVVLASVKVEAEAADPGLRGFNARRARGTGRYFDHEELVRMQPRVFTDVLRRVAGIQIQPGIERYGTGSTVQVGRNSGGLGARVCPVEFFVNGAPFPAARDGNINHFIPPEEVVAVEVYAGASQTPQEFSSGMYNTRCGVVVIWTRSGPEKQR
jgi:carboxypeptidase-like protein/TonB-dependent receptor-like protein